MTERRRGLLVALLLGLALAALAGGAARPAGAQGGPPPRPTDTGGPPPRPTDAGAPPVRPTLEPTPQPTDAPGKHRGAELPGRITGTVIELGSGAPAAGVAVQVGDLTLATDQNGNYDAEGLAAGAYTVALRLAAGQGEAAQGPLTLRLAAGAVLVQHLAFRAPAAAAASPAPTAAPAPTPAALPDTGAAGGGAGVPALALGLLGLLALAGGAALRLGARE
jgi:hypothetical protein